MSLSSGIVNHIKMLENKHGYLTPELIVNDAMNPNSPLHSQFTWDKDSAAHAYWLVQARNLIRSVKVVFTVDTKTIQTVAYVRDPTKGKEQGYLSIDKIRNNEDLARSALANEFKSVGHHLKRARRLAAVFGLNDKVEEMEQDVQKMRHDIEVNVLHS